MRLVIISDSHGSYDNFKKIVLKHLNESNAFLFLGDGLEEYYKIEKEFPDEIFCCVKGNNDIFYNVPLTRVVNYGNVNILMSHGHEFSSFYFNESISNIALQNKCQIALYGHTHVPKTEYYNGVHILNPGSIRLPRAGSKKSYGIIDITDTSIFKFIIDAP